MTIHVRDTDGSIASIYAVHIRETDETLVDIGALRIRDATGISDVLQSLSVVGDYNYASGTAFSSSAIPVSTNSITVNAAGGTGPYTFKWTFADSGWSATAPTSSSTVFRSPPVSPNDSSTTTATVTATDANDATATFDVTCFVSNLYFYP